MFEALPGVLGSRGTRAYFSGEQMNKGPKMRGTGEQRQFWGTGNREKQDFVFGEQGKKAIYFKETRESVAPWEGLMFEECGRRTDGRTTDGRRSLPML